MADRVAIICGTTSGRDHFPFPVVTSTVGAGSIYPIGLSLQNACTAFYRVKRWQIAVDITVDGTPDDTVLTATYYADGGAVVEDGSATEAGYDRESDLVVPRLTFSSDSSVTSNFALFSHEDDAFFGAGERMAYSGGLLYPSLYCDADGAVATTDDAFGSGVSGVSFSFMGQVISMFGSAAHSGTIIVTPHEYWPYATKAGLPVYNTTTGAQINSPLS